MNSLAIEESSDARGGRFESAKTKLAVPSAHSLNQGRRLAALRRLLVQNLGDIHAEISRLYSVYRRMVSA